MKKSLFTTVKITAAALLLFNIVSSASAKTIDEIKALPVKELCENDCLCFMWVVDSFLKEGIELLESWGFKYKTIAFNWVKHYESGTVCVNFAPYTLKSWEVCILGVKGKVSNIKICNSVQQCRRPSSHESKNQ